MLVRACGPLLLALLVGACGESSRPSEAQDEQLDNASELLNSAPEALGDIDAEIDEAVPEADRANTAD